ncbi:serine/threonine-protein kinase [Streptosporangium vulgare]|uniref:serine/threonine-protein kinase n=1 Tax=Streptosporangium vulgare TaxID=46190 RepID=UPI0031CE01E0
MSRRAGGMGEVWFGYDKRLDRPVAVKFIRIDRQADGRPDDELTKRFVRESRITARLEHPGVPTVYDCGSHGDDLYLVMQLINGCPVSSLLDETEVPVAWAVAIAAQVCSVLAVAHAGSLVHRDLKPGNLMLCPDGTVKVLDFGIAAALGPNVATKLTGTGVVVCTPAYMAPEQAMNGVTSRRSDLYSLGVVLDEMLAGDNQFAGPTALALDAQPHRHRAPAAAREKAGRPRGAGAARPVAARQGTGQAASRRRRGLRAADGLLPQPAAVPRLCEPRRTASGTHVRGRRRADRGRRGHRRSNRSRWGRCRSGRHCSERGWGRRAGRP